MPTCFLVLGPPRSGTSAVAGVLHHLGVVMGREVGPGRFDWPDPNEWCPRGFYQDAEFENAQDALFGDGFPEVGAEPDAGRLGRFRDLVDARCARGHDWGAKTTRMQWLLPEFLARCTDDVRLVVTRRPAEQSAASWAARAGVTAGDAAEVVRRCSGQLRDALAWPLAAGRPRLEVGFDRLLRGDGAARLAEFVGRPLTAAARSVVDPSLRRF